MKYAMIHTKPGIVFSYLMAGGTSATGATHVIKGQEAAYHVHSWLGLELGEWALCIGIAGTLATVLFQYLNYRNNKKP
jgi:hypothetical protein